MVCIQIGNYYGTWFYRLSVTTNCMKKLIIIGLLLVLVTQTKSQQYFQVMDPTSRWIEYTNWFEIGWENTFFVSGDTTIENRNYKKVYEIFYHSILDTVDCELIGGIREENNKMFFIPCNNNPLECIVSDPLELLLYDFNMSIGDTITYSVDSLNSLHNIAFNIDSIQINGDYRKRIEVHSVETAGSIIRIGFWIEGIGSTLGLFSPIHYTDCGPGAFNTELLCYYEDNTYIYSPFDSIYCNTVGIEHLYDKEISMKVYPNPTNGMINICLSRNIESRITVYNIFGEEMISKKFNGNISFINLSKFAKGIYIMNIEVDNEVMNHKIIVN